MLKNKFKYFIFSLFIFLSSNLIPTFGDNLIFLFPIDNYSQNITSWISPNNPDYNQDLLSPSQQQARMEEFYNHYFSSNVNGLSPWGGTYVNLILQDNFPNDIQSIELNLVKKFNNQDKSANKIGYGENFRPYTTEWITNIRNNMNLSQFNPPVIFQKNKRAITITNLQARVLPTDDPHFYSYQIPGQGYPFDNLEMSSIWAGTPVYVIGKSIDGNWLLVLTPDIIAWIHSDGIAYTDDAFVNQWQNSAHHQLAAILKTQTPIINTNSGLPIFLAYVGSVFPIISSNTTNIALMIPERDKNGQAQIISAMVTTKEAISMPLTATPHNFSIVLSTLKGRPYGWGGYNFYNDCSAEIKSLFTPFGIYLPRHSSDQVYAGKMVDESSESMNERINYLVQHGHKFTTIIYVGGHVFLYIGNFMMPTSPEIVPMTYQNIWGLRPKDDTRRAVIGESVFFPLLAIYPEDPTLQSLADKTYFQISFLDEMPPKKFKESHFIDLFSLMFPD